MSLPESVGRQPAFLSLRDTLAERSAPVVLWIGAGLSKEAGLPLWEELYSRLKTALMAKDADEAQTNSEALHQLEASGKSPWVRMDFLQRKLGKETYRQLVRSVFSRSETCPVPEVYKSLMGIPHRGIVNFNLDLLAQRAFGEHSPSTPVVTFTGQQVGSHFHVLRDARPFIANVHGQFLDESSWVLTHSDYTRITETTGYLKFLRAILDTKVVVFVGVSATDTAIASLFEKDVTEGHYWLTHDIATQTREWAESHGVQMVRYYANGRDHSQLTEMIREFTLYQPTDSQAPPRSCRLLWTSVSPTRICPHHRSYGSTNRMKRSESI